MWWRKKDNHSQQRSAFNVRSNGQIVLLHRLCEGQHATVLQLPVAPRVSGAEAQKHRAVA